jgi:hypothetical protein
MAAVSRRAALLTILGFVAVLCTLGPGLDWWRGRQLRAKLSPIVRQFNALGANLRIAELTRSRAVGLLVGTVADEEMENQLRVAVFNVFQDTDQTERLINNVRTHSEVSALEE